MAHDAEAAALDALPRVEVQPEITEDLLALAFTKRHRDELRYCHAWGTWLRWDGARWAAERTLAVFDLARGLARDVGATVTSERLAAKIQSAATVAAIVSLARSDRAHARVTEDFDCDPWLLNTPAGTWDLRTRTQRPHDPQDGITMVTPVSTADDEAPVWRQCLDTWTGGNADFIAFLQRLVGYWITGSVKEEVLAIIHGPGANGKTKFVETLRSCLGHDYVTGLAMETLMVTSGEQHPTDMADLRGKRLAIATETEEGRRLAEAKIKALTGGDRIRARHMRKDFFEFEPTHKLVIVGNHRPVLRNVDEAIRRRVVLIPFTAIISPEARDPDLAEKLLAERPAILRWMLNGCFDWQDHGLTPPAMVRDATTGYLAAADALGRWLDERCVRGGNCTVSLADAYADWRTWAEKAGEFVGSQRRFDEQVERLEGIDRARLGKGRSWAWIGLGLLPREEKP